MKSMIIYEVCISVNHCWKQKRIRTNLTNFTPPVTRFSHECLSPSLAGCKESVLNYSTMQANRWPGRTYYKPLKKNSMFEMTVANSTKPENQNLPLVSTASRLLRLDGASSLRAARQENCSPSLTARTSGAHRWSMQHSFHRVVHSAEKKTEKHETHVRDRKLGNS